jgi:hypothetical protein
MPHDLHMIRNSRSNRCTWCDRHEEHKRTWARDPRFYCTYKSTRSQDKKGVCTFNRQQNYQKKPGHSLDVAQYLLSIYFFLQTGTLIYSAHITA